MKKPTQPSKEDETGQTVQPETETETGNNKVISRESYFEVAEDEDHKWHWVLWSSNGRPMALNAIAYERRNDATNAISAFKMAVTPNTKIVVAHT